jgi:hypothetical protein
LTSDASDPHNGLRPTVDSARTQQKEENMKHALVLVSVGFACACGDDPLRALPPLASTQPVSDDGAASAQEAPADERVGDTTDTQEDDVDNTPTGVECVDGGDGSSWRDALPAVAAAAAVPNQLAIGAGEPRAGCVGDPVATTAADSWGDIASTQLHIGGRWYGEVTVQGDPTAIPAIGVFAAPASNFDLLVGAPFFDVAPSVASFRPTGPGVVGVAADLDAGVVTFYGNGALIGQAPVSLIPGVGGYALGAVASPGNLLRVNFGSAPFGYTPPDGFRAWSSDADGGPCNSDVAVLPPAAAVDGAETTFLASIDNDIELVVLGAYDTGGTSGWRWGDNGEEIDTGTFERGNVRVQLRRPGRVALVLSAYEPTDWILELGTQTQLEVVMVRGMHPPTLTGVPDGVPVDIASICTDGDGGNCSGRTGSNFPIAPIAWPFEYGGGDTQGFIDYVEAELCLPLTIFGGAYTSQSFIVQ